MFVHPRMHMFSGVKILNLYLLPKDGKKNWVSINGTVVRNIGAMSHRSVWSEHIPLQVCYSSKYFKY